MTGCGVIVTGCADAGEAGYNRRDWRLMPRALLVCSSAKRIACIHPRRVKRCRGVFSVRRSGCAYTYGHASRMLDA